MAYRKSQNQSPYFTTARYAGKCAETGKEIKIGDKIAYYPSSRKCYCDDSKQAAELRGAEFSAGAGLADSNW